MLFILIRGLHEKTRPVNPDIVRYFASPTKPLHRQHLAMRSFYFDGASAEEVATKYGYTVHSVYSMAKMFCSHRLAFLIRTFVNRENPGCMITDGSLNAGCASLCSNFENHRF